MIRKWHLYIIQCCDGSLYTGITIDVARRFGEHCGKGKAGAKYLRSRSPLKLVYRVNIGGRNLAMKVERKVKALPKDRKEKLIAGDLDITTIIRRLKKEMVEKKRTRAPSEAASLG